MRDLKKQERTAIEAVPDGSRQRGKRVVNPPTPISWSMGNELLLTSQPSNGAALAKVTPPSLV
jgi:hypothetical protein